MVVKATSRVVRIDKELIPPLERLIAETRDEFGRRKYRSMTRAVTEAVEDFLKKHDFPQETKKRKLPPRSKRRPRGDVLVRI